MAFEETADEKLEATVAAIIADVKKRGDAAVLEYTRKFDRLPLADAAAMELPKSELHAAFEGLPADQKKALEQAAQRVTDYHKKQVQSSWNYLMTTARCSVNKSRRWIASACMCRAARRPIPLRC